MFVIDMGWSSLSQLGNRGMLLTHIDTKLRRNTAAAVKLNRGCRYPTSDLFTYAHWTRKPKQFKDLLGVDFEVTCSAKRSLH